ncbi:MAG TPA: response regulator transcription factor [Candidatus Sulfopaludibacter sp.]|nr:response regulator transcription factor [Candidatus Sulfopaludibacter sp.]
MKSAKHPVAADDSRRRIFVVEDHPITRHGLVTLINQEADLQVCGEADDAVRSLETIKTLKPDMVLVDITLPRKSGLELIKELRLWIPKAHVLVLSMHDEKLYAERVLRAGGHGYIMKSEGGEKLLQVIRHVLAGKTYVSEAVASWIVDAFAGRRKNGSDSSLGLLTDREFEVFQLLGQGLPSTEIGQRLHLSPKTVDSHRLHIKEKLNLHSLPELMRYAVRWAATEERL